MKPDHVKARLKHDDAPKKAGKIRAQRMARHAAKQSMNNIHNEKEPRMTFSVTMEVTPKRIADLLCTGFEGGVGYWCRIMDYTEPTTEPKGLVITGEVFPHCDYPVQGGAVICRLQEEETDEKWNPLVLDAAAIQRGLKIMSEKYPTQWGNFLAENEDADTGDTFIQCCLLGETVYG